MEKVIVYIDGFNLYFGLKSKGWQRYFWLNLVSLSENILKTDQELVVVKYFTSRVSSPPSKSQRQGKFIEALETLDNLKIYYGKYQPNAVECDRCHRIMSKPNEKMTDVNIAVEMLTDAFQNNFDSAVLISGDSDLSAPIRTIRKIFPNKRVICAFPPERFSFELSKIVHAYFTIGRKKFAESLFPDKVTKNNGFILEVPGKWSKTK